MESRDGPPWVAIPERLDRRLRLGPFASARDAGTFVAVLAVGAVASLAVAPWAGLPFVVLAGLLVFWRPDGERLDETVAAVARWTLRRTGWGGRVTGPRGRPAGRAGSLQLPDGRWAAVVRTGGVPLAFLPPSELARQFEQYRQLLRSTGEGLIVLASSAPIHAGSIAPLDPPGEEAERLAWAGYRELVGLLARRRAVRRVLIAVIDGGDGDGGGRRLETAAELLRDRLADLGLRSERLRDRSLDEAAHRLGLSPPGTAT